MSKIIDFIRVEEEVERENKMDKENILRKIEQHCVVKEEKKHLACASAFKIAEELEIPVSQVGAICNENGIKIKHCQIGCFK